MVGIRNIQLETTPTTETTPTNPSHHYRPPNLGDSQKVTRTNCTKRADMVCQRMRDNKMDRDTPKTDIKTLCLINQLF